MIDDPTPYEPSETLGHRASSREGGIVFANWIAFYLILTVLLVLTAPVTSHSDNWTGIIPAFWIMLFGAFRLARAGAKASTAFIYGCSTTLLFLYRFLSMGRFSLWLEYQAPPTFVLVVMWIAICMFLGSSAFAIAYFTRDVPHAGKVQ